MECGLKQRYFDVKAVLSLMIKKPGFFLHRVILSIRDSCASKVLDMRQIILFRGEDGYWVAECPSLPGCISQRKTREEAIKNIREAIQGYIAALEEDGLDIK